MKLLRYKITPTSSFVSFPKGDMLFGQFASMLFLKGDDTLKNYLTTEPKIIFSDFLPRGYVMKPTLPLSFFGVNDSVKKEFRKKQFISLENLQKGKLQECEEVTLTQVKTAIRNAINRKTFSTDDSGVFSPYGIEEINFLKEPTLYVLYDEDSFSSQKLTSLLQEMGRVGFGKKSSIGKGQFRVELDENFKGFENISSSYYLTLSPTLLNGQKNIEKVYYEIFNRFGKHSNSNNAFKKPLLMVQSGAVVKLKKQQEYIGKPINNGYKELSFVQGYSIVVPFEMEG